MSLFTKKHYEFIAKEINIRYKLMRKRGGDIYEIQNFVHQLANSFEHDNKNFNMNTFIKKALII